MFLKSYFNKYIISQEQANYPLCYNVWDMILNDLKRNIADWVSEEGGFSICPEKLSLLPEKADISFCTGVHTDTQALAGILDAKKAGFPVPEGISRVTSDGIWILVEFGEGFYRKILHSYAKPLARETVLDSYALQRMKMLARYPAHSCPENPAVRRALYLALIAGETGKRREEAERNLLEMCSSVPPEKRQELCRTCGDVARAAIELLKED